MSDNAWTDELKEEVAEAYLKREPTAENTIEIVKELADEFNKTPNGVRMILTKKGVYVKKEVATAATKSTEGSKRVNKAAAIDALKKKITAVGQDVDDDICDRLTGKAAVYIHSVLEAVSG